MDFELIVEGYFFGFLMGLLREHIPSLFPPLANIDQTCAITLPSHSQSFDTFFQHLVRDLGGEFFGGSLILPYCLLLRPHRQLLVTFRRLNSKK